MVTGADEPAASVDAAWYVRRYPDVAAAGMDPAEHYRRHGRAEGRFPDAASEAAAATATRADGPAGSVDPAWYRARYPDLARAGVDPAEHYRLHGRAEGRHPSADAEPRAAWDTRFDPVWYRARNPDLGAWRDDPLEHFRRVGILEGRAPNAAEEDRAVWRGVVDPAWYLARNPDVARRGLDPLEHFITQGLIDRRRPNADAPLEGRDVTEARIARLKGGTFGGVEIALFVTHSPDGAVKPHVAHHVACLARCGIDCALVVACDDPDAPVTGEAAGLAGHVFRRANQGFDFAAWAHVLRLHPELHGARVLYLMNDSVFGPTSPEALEAVVARVRASAADLVGLTDNADRGWHVQSYFLALKRGFLGAPAGRAFFGSVVAYADKNDVVNEYETQLARHALAHGHTVEVLFPTPDWLDATLHNWRRLLRAGFPYLKVGTARGLVASVETADWRAAMAARGYDTGPADRTLAGLAGRAQDGALAEMHAFLADGGEVDLSGGPAPRTSFLLVLDGRPARALRLLRALAAGERAAFVIVDNGSEDDTHHVLARLPGAVRITNVQPMPPSRAARQALARARGETVVLLRTDAPAGLAPDAAAPDRAARDLPEDPPGGLPVPGDGVTYAARAPGAGPWRVFDVAARGLHLGTGYAMAREDAAEVLAALLGPLDPAEPGATPGRGVL